MKPSQREIAVQRVVQQLTAALQMAKWCRRNSFDRFSIYMLMSETIKDCIDQLEEANATTIH